MPDLTEKLGNKLDACLEHLMATASGMQEFAGDQLPLVASEIVADYMLSSIVGLSIWGFLFTLFTVFAVRNGLAKGTLLETTLEHASEYRHYSTKAETKKYSTPQWSDTQITTFLGSVAISLITCIPTGVYLYWTIRGCIAPRLIILEYVSQALS